MIDSITQSQVIPAGPPPASPKPFARKRRRWFRRGAIGGCLLLAALAIACKVYLARVEANALRLASTGASLNTFLKGYVDALKTADTRGLLSLYVEDYADDRDGSWDEDLQSNRDGVAVYAWRSQRSGTFNLTKVRNQSERLIGRFVKIDSGKIRIASIESLADDGSAVIRAILWLRGVSPEQRTRESWATLRLRLRPRGSSWKIIGKELVSGQTVIGTGQGFVDITEASGIGGFKAAHNPMLEESEWFPKKFGIMKYVTAGVAAADYDSDGWCDIFFCDGANPRLYRNRGDGTFEDVTTKAGLPPN